MTHTPFRTGITTIKLLLRKICKLLVTYETSINQVVPENKRVFVSALRQACEDFILEIPNPRP